MQRFFLSPGSFKDDQVIFPHDIAHQIRRVLRLTAGDRVVVLDGSNNEMLIELSGVTDRGVTGDIISRKKNTAEADVKVSMLIALTQREKFELILQKCTEIGAAAIIPMITSRSLVQDINKVSGKVERWKNIIREAGEQSGRGIIPELSSPLKYDNAIKKTAKENSLLLIPWENEGGLTLKEVLSDPKNREQKTIAILIGPEGGFSAEEVQEAQTTGFISLSLGPRILRMETAAMVTLALVLYDIGQMM